MSDAHRSIMAGDLDVARQRLAETLRADPNDQGARMSLFQLMCVLGEWEKALSHLRALAQLAPDAQMLSSVYGQTIAAERVRADAFAGKVPVPSLAREPPWISQLADSIGAFGRGESNKGFMLREQALEQANDSPGTWGEEPFEFISDSDARFGPAMEAIIAGHWGLIAFEAIQEVKSEGPKDLRDLVWLPAEITLRGGVTVAGFLPVRYPGTELASDCALRLGRRTEWITGASGEEGLGQRQLFADNGREFDFLSLRRLSFH